MEEEEEEEEEEDEGSGARLYDSLYETVLKNELPRQTVEDLVRIFGYDVDFHEKLPQVFGRHARILGVVRIRSPATSPRVTDDAKAGSGERRGQGRDQPPAPNAVVAVEIAPRVAFAAPSPGAFRQPSKLPISTDLSLAAAARAVAVPIVPRSNVK